MSRIFVTGDCHGSQDIKKLDLKHFPEQKHLTRDDIIIVAGDFGAPWDFLESQEDRFTLKWHENKTYTTLFVDGNHENFDALQNYPVIEFHGAICHQIRPHVLHVMRGEVIQIAEHRILCMGGAVSIDKQLRQTGASWWPEEEPSYQEWHYAVDQLGKWRPDIIITHDAPGSVIKAMQLYENDDPDAVERGMEQLLQIIKDEKSPVKNWYFGHHHRDADTHSDNIRYRLVFNRILEL